MRAIHVSERGLRLYISGRARRHPRRLGWRIVECCTALEAAFAARRGRMTPFVSPALLLWLVDPAEECNAA